MYQKLLKVLSTWLSSPWLLYALLTYVAAIVLTLCLISLITSDPQPIFKLLTFVYQAIRWRTIASAILSLYDRSHWASLRAKYKPCTRVCAISIWAQLPYKPIKIGRLPILVDGLFIAHFGTKCAGKTLVLRSPCLAMRKWHLIFPLCCKIIVIFLVCFENTCYLCSR